MNNSSSTATPHQEGTTTAPPLTAPRNLGSKFIGLLLVLGSVCAILNFIVQTIHSL